MAKLGDDVTIVKSLEKSPVLGSFFETESEIYVSWGSLELISMQRTKIFEYRNAVLFQKLYNS